jgi:hypothetical protein
MQAAFHKHIALNPMHIALRSPWLALALACLISLNPQSCMSASRDTVKNLIQAIDASLPAGTDKSRVLALLDAHSVEHSDYIERERKIYAIVREVEKSALATTSVQFEFIFDERGQLLRYTARDVVTAP